VGHTYIMGIADKPSLQRATGYMLEGQVKTMSPRVDPHSFADDYARTWHAVVYGLAYHLAPGAEWQRDFGIAKPPFYGYGLDIAVKNPYPSRPINTTKDGRITEAYERKLEAWEEKTAAWEDTLFVYEEVQFDEGVAEGILEEQIIPRINSLPNHGLIGLFNPSACNNWWRGPCPYKGAACDDEDFDPMRYRRREPDYVDKGAAQ